MSRSKNIYDTFLIIIIWFVIVVVNVFRFYNLENVPFGFHVDELASATTVQCLATQERGIFLQKPKIFFDVNYGTPKAFLYIYPSVLWTKIFGFSIASFRAYTVFGYLITVLGLFFLSKILFFFFLDKDKNDSKSKKDAFLFGSLTVLVSSISPWMWTFSRISYESPFALIFLVWGLCFFFKSEKISSFIAAAFLFSCAAYCYPPMRLQLPLLLAVCFIVRQYKMRVPLKFLFVFITILFLLNVPIILGIMKGSLQKRFDIISIFSKDFLLSQGKQGTFFEIAGIFLKNFFFHFHPKFLFLTGDNNYMNSTRFCGILSWVDILSLFFGIIFLGRKIIFKKKNTLFLFKSVLFLLFLFVNIIIGVISSALTHEGLPHSLRIIGSWPFMMLLSSFLLYKAIKVFPQVIEVIILTAILFSTFYLRHYFMIYPEKSKGMFSCWTKEQALAAKTEQDWLVFMATYSEKVFHLIYYCMNYKPNETCSSCQKKWKIIYDYLHKKNPY